MLVKSKLCFICLLLLGATYTAFAQDSDEDSLDRDYGDELPRVPAVEPNDALATFEVHPDFRIELAAAEPLVHDPIAMAFDEDGRMFVVEMRGYSERHDANIGAIRMLEDLDGDGVFDTSTIYVDGLAWPTAVACYNGGVFVGEPPNILYCKDTDGDGVADVRETVFTGFQLTNVQGLLNTFLWGLDNRIHGATSSSGAEVRRGDDPAGLPLTLRGRDFAFDPSTGEITAESGGAQHGMGYDDSGRKFVCSNSDHIQLVMFDDHYMARNPYFAAPGPRVSMAEDGPAADVYRISPVEPWRVLRTRLRVKGLVPGPVEGGGTAAGYFTSATGVTIYRGDAWPAEYRGNAFIGDVGSNLIHRKTLDPDGVGLIARRADENTEFVRSTDIWFRPVQFANGPDGALYVADMYREVIEHPESLPPIIKRHLDLNSGENRGRIYRIVAKDHVQRPLPRLSEADSSALVGLLDHPNAWHRETAARLLSERNDASAAPALEGLAGNAQLPMGRIGALYALDGLDALTAGVVLTALQDEHPWVREHALRLAEQFADDPRILAAMTGLSDDLDLRVRYQLAFSLGAARGSERNEALVRLARTDGGDKWFQVAIMSSAFTGADAMIQSLLNDASYRQNEASRSLLDLLARQAGATGETDALSSVLASIDGLPVEEDALAQTLVRSFVNGLKTGGRGATAQAILAGSERAEQLLASMIETAFATVADETKEPDARVDAIQTLAFAPFERTHPLLVGLMDQRQPAAVQSAALDTFAAYEAAEIAPTLIEQWPQLSAQLKSKVIEALFARPERLEVLLAAIETGAFKASYLDSTRVRSLQNHREPAIREAAEKLLADSSRAPRQDVVDAYRDLLTMTGDAARGKELFVENCSQCHRLQGVGFDVGPDLVTVAQAGPEKILMNILDPNAEINPQYINYTVETNDWESHSGIIASETATSITLRRADGETDTILRVNIDSIKSEELSIMPEGWEESMDKQALADLVTYLTTIE